jgi:hypothetical protein
MQLGPFLRTGSFEAASKVLKKWAQGKGEIKREELKLAASYPELLYPLIKAVLERDRSLLKELFGLELLSEPVEFDFPAVSSKGKAGVIRAVAFRSSRELINKPDAALETVKAFLKSEVAVLFEKTGFDGNSFQAPLAYALHAGGIPDGIMLTGELEADGDFSADRIAEKRKLARKEKRFLIWEGNVGELSDFLKREEVELPYLIATASSTPIQATFSRFEKAAGVRSVRGLDWKRLSVELPQELPPDNWLKFVKTAVENLKELTYLPMVFKLHLAFKGPAALALGIGSALGAGKWSVALYHYQGGRYHRVIDGAVGIKNIPREFSRLSFREEAEGREKALLALEIAGREIESRARELARKIDADFFCAKGGTIPLQPSEWERTAAEAYRALNEVYSRGYREINIVLSLPVPVAFSLGMAVGNLWPVKVWHHFSGENPYRPVLELNRIEKVDDP